GQILPRRRRSGSCGRIYAAFPLVDVNLADHLDKAGLLDQVHYDITEAVKAFRRGHKEEEREEPARHFEILTHQRDASVIIHFKIVCDELRDR
ncbi:hypothetical protein, partial [Halomonas maura]|uniref:hypothetical protein n=1 Tax=Halomonas maura TaxID=117606 RepID=UPI0025B45F1D